MAKPIKIGDASYGKSKKKFFKLKDGDSTFRILPPLGDLADDGKWSVYYKVHYGYKNKEGKARPFQSSLVINRNTKMVEVPDAANERLEKLKAELKIIKETKPLNKAKLEAIVKLVGGPKSNYNLDNNHYLNVLDEQGNIGVLKLRHKAKNALDMVINSLREKGVDPLSVNNGRFFVFSRSGSALDTTFSVSVKKRTIQVDGVGEVEQDIVHKLDETIIKRLGSEAAELDKLFKAATPEQIAQIVKESELATGKVDNIDEILGFGKNNNSASQEEIYEDDSSEDETTYTPAPAETKAAATEPVAAASVSTPVEAPKAAPAPAPKASSAPASTTAESIAELSEEDFLKQLGIGG